MALAGLLAGCSVVEGDGPAERIGLVERVGAAPQDTALALERTACYGTCPVYEVALYDDGEVAFSGIEHVERRGLRRYWVDPAEVRSLVAAFEADFFAIPDPIPCEAPVMDVPGTRTALRLGGRAKRVDDLGCGSEWPGAERLEALAREIDRVAETARWVGSGRD